MPQKIPDSPADILQNDSEDLLKKMEWVQLRENTAGATQTHLPDYRLSQKVAEKQLGGVRTPPRGPLLSKGFSFSQKLP